MAFGIGNDHPVVIEVLTLLNNIVVELKGIRQVLDRQQLHNRQVLEALAKHDAGTQDVSVVSSPVTVPVKEQHGDS